MLASLQNGVPKDKKSLAHEEVRKKSSGGHQHRKEGKRLLKLPKISDKFRKYLTIETQPNGGASLLRCDWRKLEHNLSSQERQQFAEQFISLGFAEVDEVPLFVTCIVDNAVEYLENVLELLGTKYPKLPVTMGSLNNKQTRETIRLGEYYERVVATYRHGTYRYGPLNNISLVGRKQEECGEYFEHILERLEECPFLRMLLPWSERSIKCHWKPNESDDGPIYWCRPGEQLIPTNDPGKEGIKQQLLEQRRRASTGHKQQHKSMALKWVDYIKNFNRLYNMKYMVFQLIRIRYFWKLLNK